ncbi:MAG: class F sortase [Flexilinea sp.]|nr:class F sortase [Flexilinea sp.]
MKMWLKGVLLCGIILLLCTAASASETAEVHLPVVAYNLDCTALLMDARGRILQTLRLKKGVPNEFVFECTGLLRFTYRVRLKDKDYGFYHYDDTVYTVHVDLYRGADEQVIYTITVEAFGMLDPETEGKADAIEFTNDRPKLYRILPETGFSSAQPRQQGRVDTALSYGTTGWVLQIPVLSVITDIVTVPHGETNYDISALEGRAGLLEGFDLPGEGGTILTGHDHLSETEIGPFAYLWNMDIGDRIFILDEDNELRIFEVYANEKIAEDDIAGLEDIMDVWPRSVTLMTCENERTEGGYANRRIVAAKPIE